MKHLLFIDRVHRSESVLPGACRLGAGGLTQECCVRLLDRRDSSRFYPSTCYIRVCKLPWAAGNPSCKNHIKLRVETYTKYRHLFSKRAQVNFWRHVKRVER